METGSCGERTPSKAAAGRPSEVADCGAGWAKLQRAGEAAAGGLGDRTGRIVLPCLLKVNKAALL